MKIRGLHSLYNEHSSPIALTYFISLRVTIALLMCTSLSVSGQSQLGPFEVETGRTNPLHPPLMFSSNPAPVLADIDKDGDKDFMVGTPTSYAGEGIRYYKNEGSITTPVFEEKYFSENPFNHIPYEYPTTLTTIRPAFGDFDKDGDLDLVVGCMQQGLRYFKNVTDWSAPNPIVDYEKQTTAWDFATGNGNPFAGINFFYSAPVVVDFDKDGDDDLILGTLADSNDGDLTIHLYTNNGMGNFTHTHLTGVAPSGVRVSPAVVDFDYDNDFDIITGNADGAFQYFQNDGSNNFTEMSGWSLFDSFELGTNIVPAFSDLNNDGLFEAIIGSSPASSPQTIAYLQNTGNNVFERKAGVHDPFGGVWIFYDATPYFSDVDSDGDDDVLFDNRRDKIYYMKNNNGVFDYAPESENPFVSITTANSFSLSYVDLNGDGEKDVVGGSTAGVQYFQSGSGTFSSIPMASGPFKDITFFDPPKTDFGDIDGDGDLDMLLSDATDATDTYFRVRYFENTGTSLSPVFTERMGTANLFGTIQEEYPLYPRLFDIDHDGDLDALIGEGGNVHSEITDSNEFLFCENTGTASAPEFTYRGNLIPRGDNSEYFSPAFSDIDHDGDFDIFEGDATGMVAMYRNNNVAPITTITSAPLATGSSQGDVLLDENITLADTDNDLIGRVVITISNFNSNDSLTFQIPSAEPQPQINYTFSDETGSLCITGKASAVFYQELLRTLRFHYNETSGFSGGRLAPSKVITVMAYDLDFTTPIAATRAVNIGAGTNAAPSFNNTLLSVVAGKSVTLDLSSLYDDVDNNLDESTLKITSGLSTAALAAITGTNLQVDFSNVVFAGTDQVEIQVCDSDNACSTAMITVEVLNTPPTFTNTSLNGVTSEPMTFDLSDLISDLDENIAFASLNIVSAPSSGANVELIDGNLQLDYSGVSFSGTETIVLEVCDFGGACAQSVISITIALENPVVVYNAVAPKGSSELNRYLHVDNLPSNNQVIIFNRWGDIVYQTKNYDNDTRGKRFEGLNDHGRALPSGTYFYKIEYNAINGRQTLTGYLSLQQ